MNYKNFKEKTLTHLSHYKNNVLKIEDNGEFRGKEYSHILPKEKLEHNFLRGVTIPNDVHLHMYAHHLNSSQVMCINFFEPLCHNDNGRILLLKILVDAGVVIAPAHATIAETTFEKVIDSTEGTNFDFYIKLSTGEKVFFEIKYTEHGFGKINPSKSDPDKYERKWNKVYNDHTQKSLLTKDMEKKMFYENYQIWRNVSYIRKDTDFVVFLFPFESSKSLMEIQNAAQTYGKSNPNINAIDWTWFVDIALTLSQNTEYHDHFTIFKEKYLSFLQA